MSFTTRSRAASARAAVFAATFPTAIMLLLLCAAVVWTPARAFAQATGSVTIGWRDAAGPVVGYDVYVSTNDSEMIYYDRVTNSEVVIGGAAFQTGDALRFQVVGVSASGSQGPPSEISDVVYLPNVPAPTNLQSQDGSVRFPTRVTWDPIPYVGSYVVFRSPTPGDLGPYFGRTTMPWLEDSGADLDVVYYYTVAAINGRQVSDFSEQVAATRGGSYPKLEAAPGALHFDVVSSQLTATQTVGLSNSGDWELAFAAWPSSPWLDVSHSSGDVDEGTFDLGVTIDVSALAPGDHQTFIQLYAYYHPPPGEHFTLGPPLTIPITVSVSGTNDPPVIESALQATVLEGQVIELAITASDPDPGDRLDVAMGQLPAFATFESLGGGSGRLIVAPGYESAGTYQPVVVAWDSSHYVVEPFTLVVEDRNRSPQAALIPDTTVAPDATSVILVFAWDPDVGDRVALTTSALPAFASFFDFGNGTGRFEFDPTQADVGEYLLLVGVVDDGSPVAFTSLSFRLIVEP